MWYEKIGDVKVSKAEILKHLVAEMHMQKRVYTNSIRKRKLTENQAIKKAACIKAAYYLIKELEEKEAGVQGTLL